MSLSPIADNAPMEIKVGPSEIVTYGQEWLSVNICGGI